VGGREVRQRVRAGPEPAPAIAPLRDTERPDAARVLARAFRDNPLNVAVVGTGSAERRLRSNAHGARALLPVVRLHGEAWAARLGRAVAGVLIGTPPYAYPLPVPPLGPRLRCLLGQGWRVSRRWAEVFQTLDTLHPPQPHRYLGTLGVDPEHQRRQVGTALLRAWLGRADEDGVPVYLETDRRENVAFYCREGFEVSGQAEILGVPIWCMQRGPRERSG
jgi:ribosomal protein S18 acetylase RimI-like enzyme